MHWPVVIVDEAQFARRVMPYPDVDLYDKKPYVGDVRVRFDLAVERAGTLTLFLTEHGRKHRLVLGRDESYAVVVRGDDEEHHLVRFSTMPAPRGR